MIGTFPTSAQLKRRGLWPLTECSARDLSIAGYLIRCNEPATPHVVTSIGGAICARLDGIHADSLRGLCPAHAASMSHDSWTWGPR